MRNRFYVDFTNDMFGGIKMRIKGELLGLDGEWELIPESACKSDEWKSCRLIRQVQVSQLQQWIDSYEGIGCIHCADSTKNGFKKAIEVAEVEISKSEMATLGIYGQSASRIVKALKRFAGLDK